MSGLRRDDAGCQLDPLGFATRDREGADCVEAENVRCRYEREAVGFRALDPVDEFIERFASDCGS
jgi:hypothetical protein